MATTKKKKLTDTPKKLPPRKSATKQKPEPEMPENVWEQLPSENSEQYAKFAQYRDMAYQGKPEDKDAKGVPSYGRRLNKRSLRRLAKAMNLSSALSLENLSAKFDWVSRCEAYDLDLDRRAREVQEAAIIKMREDHALLGAQMIRKATVRLLGIPVEDISAADLIKMADTGVRIERLSRGESTENQNVSGSVSHNGAVAVSLETEHNLSDLSDEELEQLDQLLGKVHPKSGV